MGEEEERERRSRDQLIAAFFISFIELVTDLNERKKKKEIERKNNMMTRMQIVTNKAGASAAVAARRTTSSSLSLKRSSVSKSLSVSKNVTKRTLKVNASNDELKNKAQDLLTTAQDKWAETEDKPTVVTLAATGLVTLIVLSSLLGALEKVPFLSGILELVGIGYAAYFAYNNLLFTPDREELVNKVNDLKDKVL